VKPRVVAYGAMALALLAEAPALWPSSFIVTDHLIIWYVGRVIASGGSPYLTATWVDAATRYGSPHIQEILDYGASVWPYPPWTGYLFVPFGILPVEVGPWVLHVAYIAAGLAGAIVLARMLPWRTSSMFAAALAVFAVFQPFVIAARWGQFTSFVLVGFVLLVAGMRSRSVPLLVAGALLLATKPQLTAILGVVVLVVLIRDRAARELAGAAVAVGAVLALTWLRYPEWLEAATSGSGVRIGLLEIFASTWGLAINVAPSAWPFVGGLLVLAVYACVLMAVRSSPAPLRVTTALCGALVAGVATVPLAHAYDHLLLAPTLFVALLAWSWSTGIARLTQGVLLVLLAVAVPWIAFVLSVAGPTQAVSGIVPILFAPLLLGSATLLRRYAKSA
jgi:hypothetical protein